MLVLSKSSPQLGAKVGAETLYVGQQILVSDDLLHFVRSGTGYRMALVRLAVDEAIRSSLESIYHRAVDEKCTDGLIACSETFRYGLQVRNDVFLLPGVQGARASHSRHHLI